MAAVAQSQRYGWKSLLLACLLTVCCNSVMAAGGTLKVIPHADLKNTDPIWTTAYITRNHGYMIYDTLFSLDADLQPQPQMVDTWTVSDDGLIYTFTLRDGLRWHDDAPVRAAGLCGVHPALGQARRHGPEAARIYPIPHRRGRPYLHADAHRSRTGWCWNPWAS